MSSSVAEWFVTSTAAFQSLSDCVTDQITKIQNMDNLPVRSHILSFVLPGS